MINGRVRCVSHSNSIISMKYGQTIYCCYKKIANCGMLQRKILALSLAVGVRRPEWDNSAVFQAASATGLLRRFLPADLVKTLVTFYVTRMFITLFHNSYPPKLYLVSLNPVQNLSLCYFMILFNIVFSGSSTTILYVLPSFGHVTSFTGHRDNIAVQITIRIMAVYCAQFKVRDIILHGCTVHQ